MAKLIRNHRLYFMFATTSVTLSVGAVLTVFTVVNALWLRPPPFSDPDRLVIVMGENTNDGSSESAMFGGIEHPEGWTAFETVAGQVVTSARFAGLMPRIVFAQ